jgi:transcription elongation factor GreA
MRIRSRVIVISMADHRLTMPGVPPQDEPDAATHAGLRLTQADFDALVRELDDLRRKHRFDLERRLRDAREFGSPADNDDLLSVLEEIVVDEARISQLETLVRSTFVVDDGPAFDGRAGLGCVVRVVDDAGRSAEHRLVGRRGPDAGPNDVSVGSPVGRALVSTRPGDLVRVVLPSGRDRVLRVVAVTPPATDEEAATFPRTAEAA